MVIQQKWMPSGVFLAWWVFVLTQKLPVPVAGREVFGGAGLGPEASSMRRSRPNSLCSQCATIHVCCYLNHCLESSVPRHVTSPSLSQPCFLVCYIVKRSQQNTKNIQSAVVYCCLPYYWAKAHILHEKNLTAHTKKKQKVKRKWKVYVPYWNKDEHDSICSLMYWIRVQCYLI